jgi:hypothetical protein
MSRMRNLSIDMIRQLHNIATLRDSGSQVLLRIFPTNLAGQIPPELRRKSGVPQALADGHRLIDAKSQDRSSR